MTGVALHLTDDQLEHLADVLAPRVLARLGDLEPEPAAPVAYTIASLAESLNVSEKVVRGAINRGELHAQRRGRRFYIDPDDARAWARRDDEVDRARPSRGRPRTGRPLRDAFAQLDTTANGGKHR